MPEATKPQRLWFGTVGYLRQLLDGVPDDRTIVAQVVAVDGKAWIMSAAFSPEVEGASFAVLTLQHPALTTLPELESEGADG